MQPGGGTVRGSGRSPVVMLRWAVIFLIISIIAAVFGFGGISAAAVGIAKLLFYIFLVLFVVTLIIGLFLGRTIADR